MTNKNRFSALLAAAVVLAASVSGFAQSFDVFGGNRTVIVGGPQLVGPSANNSVTNAAVNIHHLLGMAKLDLFCQTNNGGGTMTATVQTSVDSTNWTTLTYALATSSAINFTNFNYGGGLSALIVTNTYLMPGTITTPVAASAGFATPYLLSAPFTNTAAITMPGSGFASIGFNSEDASRYIRVIWTPGGTSTNIVVGALLTSKWQPSGVIP